MAFLSHFSNTVLLGLIISIHVAKCGLPGLLYCETLTAGSNKGDLLNITLECSGENTVDSFDIWEETDCNGEVVGFVAHGCYVEDFNMSIDWSLQSLVVEREEQGFQLPNLYIDLKAYCAPYNLSNFSTDNSQKINCTENSDQDMNSNENSSSFSTPKSLPTESNDSKDKNDTESSGNIQKENNTATTTIEEKKVCSELEEHPVYLQETILNAQLRVEKAQATVNYAINIVENAQKGVQKTERLVELARLTLEKTEKNLVKARESVVKAQDKLEKAQRRLDKAQQEAKRVLIATC